MSQPTIYENSNLVIDCFSDSNLVINGNDQYDISLGELDCSYERIV